MCRGSAKTKRPHKKQTFLAEVSVNLRGPVMTNLHPVPEESYTAGGQNRKQNLVGKKNCFAFFARQGNSWITPGVSNYTFSNDIQASGSTTVDPPFCSKTFKLVIKRHHNIKH